MAKIKIEDDYVKSCPDTLPAGLLEWACREVLPKDKTILYKKGNKRGYCYSCGNKITAPFGERYRQNQFSECPVCGTDCGCFLETGSAWKADYIANVATIQKTEDGTLWIREYHITRRDTRRLGVDQFVEICRWAIVGTAVAKWQKEWKENFFGIRRYNLDGWMRNQKMTDVYDGLNAFYWPENIKAMLEGTALQYMDRLPERNPIRYMLDFARYPAVEKLTKAGYSYLIMEKMVGNGSKRIRWSKNSVADALALPLWMLKWRKPEEWNGPELERAQGAAQALREGLITQNEVEAAFKYKYDIKNYKPALKYAPLASVHKYLDKLTGEVSYSQSTFYGRKKDWIDYVEMAEKLGYDLKDKSLLFPKDMQTAHDRALAKMQFEENKEKSLLITAYARALDKYRYEACGLLIRPVEDWQELKKEGDTLHHCVATYADKVAKRTTSIFVVRRTADPDTPYYTLELRNKTIVQCRTLHNASYINERDVANFIDEWLAVKVEKRKPVRVATSGV